MLPSLTQLQTIYITNGQPTAVGLSIDLEIKSPADMSLQYSNSKQEFNVKKCFILSNIGTKKVLLEMLNKIQINKINYLNGKPPLTHAKLNKPYIFSQAI